MFNHKLDRNFLIFAAAFFVIFSIISVYYFCRIYQPWGTSWTDFTVFNRAGGRIIKSEPIYNLSDGLDVYKYSPAFAFFMAPLSRMHMHKTVPLWYFLTFILILFLVYFVKEIIRNYRQEKTLPKSFYFISFFLTLRFLLVLLSRVQSDFLVLFFLALSAWFLSLRKEPLSGFALATAIMVKLTPLIFLPYFLYRKFYKAFFSSLIAILLYLSLPALGLGWSKNAAYLKDWFGVLSVSTPDLLLWYKNQSLLSCISRLFSGSSPVNLIVLPPLFIKGIFSLVSSVMVFLALYFCRTFVAQEKKDFGYAHLIEFSLILICMVLFSPLAWKHTFLHLFIPHMVLIYYLMKHPGDFMAMILMATSFILSSVLNPEILKSYDEIVSLYSNMTWGTIILFVALLRAARQLKKKVYATP